MRQVATTRADEQIQEQNTNSQVKFLKIKKGVTATSLCDFFIFSRPLLCKVRLNI